MKTITLTDEELALLHEHLIWLYDLILSLSWNGSYEQKDSYVCNVKSMYKHILDIIDDAREDK